MRLVRLSLENFKVHKSLDIVFDPQKNLIIGENGTGKTTIFHAIIYSLFGKEAFPWIGTRRTEALIRHLASSAKLRLELEDINGKRYSIIRAISVAGEGKAIIEEEGKIISAGIDIVNKKIKELLKINSISKILDILYIKQGDLGKFVGLAGKSEFTDILEELFDIKTYSNYLDIVQGLIRDLTKELDYLQREKYHLSRDIEQFKNIFKNIDETELERMYKEYNDLKKKREYLYKKFVEAKTLYSSIDSKLISQENFLREKYKELESKYNVLSQKLSELRSERKNLSYEKYSEELIEKSIEDLENMLNDIEKEIKDLDKVKLALNLNNSKEKLAIIDEFLKLKGIEDKYNYLKNHLEVLNGNLIEISNNIKNLEKILDILKSSKEKSCPICKRPLDEEDVKRLVENYSYEIKKLKDEKLNIERELSEYKREFEEIERKYLKYKYLREKLGEYNIPIENIESEMIKLRSQIEDIESKLKMFEEYDIIKGTINYLKSREIDKAINKLEEEMRYVYREMKEVLKNISSIDLMKKNLEEFNNIMNELGYNSLYDLESEIKRIDEELKKYENFKPELYKMYVEKMNRYNNLIEKIKKVRKNISLLNSLQTSLIRFIEKLRKKKTIRLSEEFRKYFKKLYRYGDIVDVKIDLRYGRNKEKIFDIVIAKNIDGKVLYKNIGEAGLSGGQIKILDLALRLALASIIRPNFKVLMLDEPTESLDENVRFSLAELLDSLGEYQIILCTHDELFKEKISGKVIEFKRTT